MDESVLKSGSLVLGRFEVRERVAKGGFATVWRAHDRVLGKDVALKVLHTAIADDPAAVEDMKRETLRSRELSHPHIVHTYDFVQEGHVAAIAMEFVDGETLAALAAKRPNRCFDPPDLAEWMADICDALDYAHTERGSKPIVVHHDIKPGNFMIDSHGVAKVLDFGIAKSVAETRYQHTGQFAVAGTPPYMGPQQLRGNRPHPGDDIYSLGATLYALLTSKPPFFRGDLQVQIPSVIPPSMEERRAEFEIEGGPIAPEWEETVAACLAKAIEDRPPTIGDVAIRLGIREPSSRRRPRAVADSGPASGTRVLRDDEGAPDRTEIASGSHRAPSRRPWWIAGAAVAVAAAAVAAFVSQREENGAAVEPAREEAAQLSIVADDPPVEKPATTESEPAPSIEPEVVIPAPAVSIPPPRENVPPPVARDDSAERQRLETIRGVRGEIATAIDASQWDSATRGLSTLAQLAPDDASLTTWRNLVREGRERDARIAELETSIPSAMARNDWTQARRLLGELTQLAPAHGGAAAWSRETSDQLAVRQLVEQYRTTQESLDADAYRVLWVDLSSDNLQKIRRSYADLRAQTLTLEGLTAEIAGDAATLRFRESRSVDLRAGGRHASEGTTVLKLRKVGDAWKIASRSTEG